MPWYEAWPAKLLYAGRAMAAFGFVFRGYGMYDEYVCLPRHGIPAPVAPAWPDAVSAMEQHLQSAH